jgi:hypothetical protein
MQFRESSLLESVRAVEELSGGSSAPDRDVVQVRRREEEDAFQSLLDDPEACWEWMPT